MIPLHRWQGRARYKSIAATPGPQLALIPKKFALTARRWVPAGGASQRAWGSCRFSGFSWESIRLLSGGPVLGQAFEAQKIILIAGALLAWRVKKSIHRLAKHAPAMRRSLRIPHRPSAAGLSATCFTRSRSQRFQAFHAVGDLRIAIRTRAPPGEMQ